MKFTTVIAFVAVAVVAVVTASDTQVNHPLMDELLSQMSAEQKACLKTNWQKDGEAMKAAGRACYEQDGGIDCVKAIPQVKACMA